MHKKDITIADTWIVIYSFVGCWTFSRESVRSLYEIFIFFEISADFEFILDFPHFKITQKIFVDVSREKKKTKEISQNQANFVEINQLEWILPSKFIAKFDLVDFIWMEINRQNWKYWEKYSDKFRNYHIQRDTTIDTISILIFHLCETNVNVMTSDDTQSEQNYTQNTWMETRTMKTNDKHERKRSTHKIGRHYCSDREWIQFI